MITFMNGGEWSSLICYSSVPTTRVGPPRASSNHITDQKHTIKNSTMRFSYIINQHTSSYEGTCQKQLVWWGHQDLCGPLPAAYGLSHAPLPKQSVHYLPLFAPNGQRILYFYLFPPSLYLTHFASLINHAYGVYKIVPLIKIITGSNQSSITTFIFLNFIHEANKKKEMKDISLI